VILARRANLSTITAVAWTHLLRSDSAGDLRTFATRWLGHGAAGRTSSIVGNQ
jgi:hypothetical protein